MTKTVVSYPASFEGTVCTHSFSAIDFEIIATSCCTLETAFSTSCSLDSIETVL